MISISYLEYLFDQRKCSIVRRVWNKNKLNKYISTKNYFRLLYILDSQEVTWISSGAAFWTSLKHLLTSNLSEARIIHRINGLSRRVCLNYSFEQFIDCRFRFSQKTQYWRARNWLRVNSPSSYIPIVNPELLVHIIPWIPTINLLRIFAILRGREWIQKSTWKIIPSSFRLFLWKHSILIPIHVVCWVIGRKSYATSIFKHCSSQSIDSA